MNDLQQVLIIDYFILFYICSAFSFSLWIEDIVLNSSFYFIFVYLFTCLVIYVFRIYLSFFSSVIFFFCLFCTLLYAAPVCLFYF